MNVLSLDVGIYTGCAYINTTQHPIEFEFDTIKLDKLHEGLQSLLTRHGPDVIVGERPLTLTRSPLSSGLVEAIRIVDNLCPSIEWIYASAWKPQLGIYHVYILRNWPGLYQTAKTRHERDALMIAAKKIIEQKKS